MATKLHSAVAAGARHPIHQLEYPDAANRIAGTGETTGATPKLYDIARQTDDNSLWLLTALTPTWAQILTSSADSVTAGGAVYFARVEVAAATKTVQADEYLLGVTYTVTGAVTVTLPAAVNGRSVVVVDEGNNAGTNNITIQTSAPATVATIAINGGSRMCYSDGTNWFAV